MRMEIDALRTATVRNPTLEAIEADPAEILVRAGLTPDSWQTRLLRCSHDRVLICASRQSGKSTVSAALALKTALLSESLVLLVSPSLRQSAELLLKVLAIYRGIGRPIPTVRSKDNALRLDLANG